MSSSEIGFSMSTLDGVETTYYGYPRSAGHVGGQYLMNDFVGLNSTIYDPITASQNFLGYEDFVHRSNTDYNYQGGLIIRASGVGHQEGIAKVLNGLLHHRNGPYQHPSWKQIRGGQHPIARYHRRKNTFSIDESDPIPNELIGRTQTTTFALGSRLDEVVGQQKSDILIGKTYADGQYGWITYLPSGRHSLPAHVGSSDNFDLGQAPELSRVYTDSAYLNQYYEPVVTTKYKPFTYDIDDVGGQPARVRQSMMNHVNYFSNKDLNTILRISSGDLLTSSEGAYAGWTSYKHLNTQTYSLWHAAAKNGANSYILSERLYPRDINSYRTYKLTRPFYEETGSHALGFFDDQSKDIDGNNIIEYLTIKKYDFRPGDKRTFWKSLQGGGTVSAASDGTTRLRTNDRAANSISSVHKLWGYTREKTAYQKQTAGIGTTTDATDTHLYQNWFSGNLIATSAIGQLPADKQWNNNTKFLINGVVINQQNALTGATVGGGITDIGDLPPFSMFSQLESYQPYEISALSIWPLDPRQDIYDKPIYLTSSMGGEGLQIGLTPHRATTLSAANCTVSVADGDASTGMTEGEYLKMTATDGTVFIFIVSNIAESGAATTGAGLSIGDDIGAGTVPNSTPFNLGSPDMIAIGINLSSATQYDFLSGLHTAINAKTGGRIVSTNLPGSAANGAQTITLTQRDTGAAGNTIVSTTISQLTVSQNHTRHDRIGFAYGNDADAPFARMQIAQMITASILNLKTGSAGELVYSTKPTLFYYRTGSAVSDLSGYGQGKASIQYNRHTFPYNTPFYATNKIRGNDPWYNTYEDFFGNLKHMGRDYSIVPEFNISEHLSEYYKKGFPLDYGLARQKNVFDRVEIKRDPLSPEINIMVPLNRSSANSPYTIDNSTTNKSDIFTVHGGIVSSSARDAFPENNKVATATITVADGDATSGMTEKEHITITSSDGKTVRYVITNSASDGSTETGTILSNDANTDTGAGTAGSDEDGGVAVSINLSSGTQQEFLISLKEAIEHGNGHSNKITVSEAPPSGRDGPQSITLTQVTAGEAGNVSITTDISQLTVVGFTGGQDITESEIFKYLDSKDPNAWSHETNPASSEVTSSFVTMGNTETFRNHWRLDQQGVKFEALYFSSDDFSSFNNLLSNGRKGFSQGENTIPDIISFNVKANKKMRITDGFYPVSRTVQVARHFNDGFLYNAGNNPIVAYRMGKSHVKQESYSNVTNLRTRAEMTKQTILEPLFGPGILYNSIKSGIAVDWPIYASNNEGIAKFTPEYWFPTGSTTVAYASTDGGFLFQGSATGTDPDTPFSSWSDKNPDNLNIHISASFNFGGCQMMGAAKAIPSVLVTPPTHRLPFRALYDFDTDPPIDLLNGRNVFLPSDFVEADRRSTSDSAYTLPGFEYRRGTVGMAGTPGARYTSFPILSPEFGGAFDNSFKDEILSSRFNVDANLYHSAINNYLAETMEFFIADSEPSINIGDLSSYPKGLKLPIITRNSLNAQFSEGDLGREFVMEVKLKAGKDQVMCEGPRKAGIGGKFLDGSNSPLLAGESSLTKLGSTMRGYIYGPAMECVTPNIHGYGTNAAVRGAGKALLPDLGQTSAFDPILVEEPILASYDFELYLYFNLQDPAYQAYTPPYFYGASSKILKYEPQAIDDTYAFLWGQSLKNSFNFERYDTGSYHGDERALCLTLPTTSSYEVTGQNRMKIDASVEFSNLLFVGPAAGADTFAEIQYASYIAPWWVCPVLDFSSSFAYTSSFASNIGQTGQILEEPLEKTGLVKNIYHDIKTGRGLWGGYGTDPYDKKAIGAVLKEEALGELDKGLYLEIKSMFSDTQEENISGSVGFVANNASADGVTPGGFFTLPPEENNTTNKTGSLAPRIDFETKKYPIGKIANSKTVHEAIVIIPYLDTPIKYSPKMSEQTIEFIEGYHDLYKPLDDGTHSNANYIMGKAETGFYNLYSTVEIIPGKHFLPIQPVLFQNMLSMILTSKYIPRHKRGQFYHGHDFGNDLVPNQKNYNLLGCSTPAVFNKNLDSLLQTDVGTMLSTLIGDIQPFLNTDNLANPYHNLGYQLPPEFDFIHNGNVSPFQMMVVPFTHTFSKQDLIDIYQGIMPTISQKIEKAISTLSISPNSLSPMNSDGIMPEWMPYGVKSVVSKEAAFRAKIKTIIEQIVDTTLEFDGPQERDAAVIAYINQILAGQGNYDDLGSAGVIATESGGRTFESIFEEAFNTPGSTDRLYFKDLGYENFLSPPLRAQGMLKDPAFFKAYVDEEKSIIPNWSTKDFYKNIKFMVFKVKQRGAKDFKKYRDRQVHELMRAKYVTPYAHTGENQKQVSGESILENITYSEVWGSNWPYDYFSLIETLKIDIDMLVNK